MDRCLANGCVQFTIRLIRWVPVAFIAFVLSWAYYVYVVYICFGLMDNVIQQAVYFAIFNLLFIMMVWSYVQTIFAPIGTPPPEFRLTQEVKDDLRSASDEQTYRTILERFVRQNKIPVFNRAVGRGTPPHNAFCVRFCIKCSMVKPDRAHHCSICSQCILKFDHHCPWVNTCINFRNYKFFVLFLGYGFYLCVFGFFSILPTFIVLWRNNEFGRHGNATFHVLFLFFIAGMFGAALGGLFVYHLYLTAKNRSTIETFRPPVFHYGVDKNAYNLGIARNFVEIFGKNRLLRLFPLFTSPGDGVVFSQLSGCMESSMSTSGGGQPQDNHYNYRLTATSAGTAEEDDNVIVDCHPHHHFHEPFDVARVLPPLAGRMRNGSEPTVMGGGSTSQPQAVLWLSADRCAAVQRCTALHRADREILFHDERRGKSNSPRRTHTTSSLSFSPPHHVVS